MVAILGEDRITPVDELVRRDTMLMSNRCSSSRSMSNNRCDVPSESNLSTLRVVVAMAVVWVVDRLLGRECMMTFRSPVLVEMAMVVDVEDSRVERVVEVTEDQPRRRPDLRVLLLPMLLLDQRMLVNQVPTIVVVAEVVNVVFTPMREDEWFGEHPSMKGRVRGRTSFAGWKS